MASAAVRAGRRDDARTRIAINPETMAHKRRAAGKRRAAAEPETEQSKRYKDCVDNAVDEFVCPITTELPVDPVTAEDGRVYTSGARSRSGSRARAGSSRRRR